MNNKKRLGLVASMFVVLLLSLTTVHAEPCDPAITLLNQDPYPAVPGEYVKLVFQMTGLDNPECGDVDFELLGDYPIILNSGDSGLRTFKKVDFVKDFESNLLIPFEVEIDENALDGANDIEVRARVDGTPSILQTLQVEVKETTVLFEAYVKDYDYTTRELTVEVLNIGDSDIEAVTVEIPKQENVEIKGSSRVVVGDLDSNEFTTADFEALPKDGNININIIYSDSINVRRTITQPITFDSTYFTNRVADQKTTGTGTYIFYVVIILVVVWWVRRRIKKKKKK